MIPEKKKNINANILDLHHNPIKNIKSTTRNIKTEELKEIERIEVEAKTKINNADKEVEANRRKNDPVEEVKKENPKKSLCEKKKKEIIKRPIFEKESLVNLIRRILISKKDVKSKEFDELIHKRLRKCSKILKNK